MNSSTDLLSQLHNIHPPTPVPFWPPAPGWWIVAILVILFIMVAGWIYRRYYLSQAFKRMALKILKQLRQDYQCSGESIQLVMALSILLRRVALVKFPRHQVAGLIGRSWLQFLDETGHTKAFTQGLGQVLVTVPYQKYSQVDTEALFNLVTTWIKQQ